MTTTKAPKLIASTMTLPQLCKEIRKDWRKSDGSSAMYFGAVPYFKAMETMSNINDNFGMDSGKMVINYFLANASTWRGSVAKQVKFDLNIMVKNCKSMY